MICLWGSKQPKVGPLEYVSSSSFYKALDGGMLAVSGLLPEGPSTQIQYEVSIQIHDCDALHIQYRKPYTLYLGALDPWGLVSQGSRGSLSRNPGPPAGSSVGPAECPDARLGPTGW